MDKSFNKPKFPIKPTKSKPDHDRTGKPVVCPQRGATRSQEIETRSFREEAVKHDRTGKLVVCRDTSHAQGASQTRFSHDSTNFNLEGKTNHDRTVKLVVCRDTSHAQGASQTRSSHDSTNFNVEDETNHDRTVKPVVCRDTSHEQSMLNEVDNDFRIPGLPHSVVKDAENYRVRELVKTDNLFNEIYNKTKPTYRSVRRRRK